MLYVRVAVVSLLKSIFPVAEKKSWTRVGNIGTLVPQQRPATSIHILRFRFEPLARRETFRHPVRFLKNATPFQ